MLATGGSEDAALAARAAVDLAMGTGAELHVAHAWQAVPTTRFEAFVRARLLAGARELLEAQTALLGKAGANVAGAHLREGPTVDEVVDLAGEIGADLVVVDSRGQGPVKRLVLGSVFESVVHHALSPVLVLRGGGDAWPPRRVVIGDDGSEAARVAASLAAGIGGLFGAQGLVLRPYPELPEADLEGRPRFMTGSAAKVMAKKLKEKGGSLLVDSESFFVKGMEGPLRSGELDRAATWARMLVKEVEPTHLGAQQ